ncbi:MAG: 3-hydroxybutyryl-CoA dehydrogenase, partial [Acidobacteria bacterium]|nr:3-hydroxybutyryl-CoA dehydrogenase [Acidobacteriota bacterium]
MSHLIGVIGAGTMGNGIAQTAAGNGFEVVMCDIKEEFVERGFEAIGKSLDRFVSKEKITAADKTAILGRIKTTTSLDDLAECTLIVEAATENFDVKRQIFEKLDEITGENAILATNTSSISITKIAAATGRPEKVIGMHFFNPVP